MTTKRRQLSQSEIDAANRLKAIWSDKKNELNLTQEKVADLCGWSNQSAFGAYMLARVPLNTDAILRLAKILKVHPTEIMPEIAPLLPNNSSNDISCSESEELTNEEKGFIQLIRGLTSEQKKGAFQDIEAIKRQNEIIIKELRGSS